MVPSNRSEYSLTLPDFIGAEDELSVTHHAETNSEWQGIEILHVDEFGWNRKFMTNRRNRLNAALKVIGGMLKKTQGDINIAIGVRVSGGV